MRIVRVGMHETDCNRLDTFRDQFFRRRAERILIQRPQDISFRVDPLVHRLPKESRCERFRLLEKQIVEVIANLAPHLERVPEPFCRDQSDFGSLTFDNRIGDEGRAVHHSIKFWHAGPGFRNQPFQTVRDRKARILRCCQSLPGKNQVALLVNQHKVRERTADIDTDADAFSDITTHSPSPLTP